MMTKKHQNLSSVASKRLRLSETIAYVKICLLVCFIPIVFGGVIDYSSGEITGDSLSNRTRLDMAGTPVVIAATAKHTATVSSKFPVFLPCSVGRTCNAFFLGALSLETNYLIIIYHILIPPGMFYYA